MKLIELIKKKWFCCHEWEKFNTVDSYFDEGSRIPYKIEITLICKKCGKIKTIKCKL